ncbi:MAG: hypothetical protein H7A38_06355 [Chlamydiales bacterium]|nr:hypothetical protein [Chlamydiales bacterium]
MSDPINDGYAANIPPPQIEDPGTLSDWESMYLGLLNELLKEAKNGKAQEAFMKLPELMNIDSSYRENGQNIALVDRTNVNRTVQDYVDAIQKDFDQYSTGTNGDTAKADKKFAEDAIYANNQIYGFEKKYSAYIDPDTAADINTQLSSIFGKDTTDGDAQDLANTWAQSWDLPNYSGGTSTTDPWEGSSNYDNSFNDLRSNLSSLSSPLNAEIENNMKEASSMMETEGNMYRTITSMEKSPVTAAKTASS